MYADPITAAIKITNAARKPTHSIKVAAGSCSDCSGPMLELIEFARPMAAGPVADDDSLCGSEVLADLPFPGEEG